MASSNHRDSFNIDYAGVPLVLYGDAVWEDGACTFEADRIETETGTENIYPILSESTIDELNKAASASMTWQSKQSEYERSGLADFDRTEARAINEQRRTA